MADNDLDRLTALILQDREVLLSQWRQQVRQLRSAKNLDNPTLNDHIPNLLKELAAALFSHSEKTIPEALLEGSPPAHGTQRVKDGFDIEEVVAEYNILRGCIHELADHNEFNLQGQPFPLLTAFWINLLDWLSRLMPPSKHSTYNIVEKSISLLLPTIFELT